MEEAIIKKAVGILVIGGSAGSLEVLLEILPYLQEGLPFPIVIVLHRKPESQSLLTDLLSFKTAIPVKEVEDKDQIVSGTIYIAPADYHLLIEKDSRFSLDASEKVNYSRPSIDVSFESAADIYKEHTAGLLLSGANADGKQGLLAIQHAGGIVMVQNPDNAEVSFMPQQALNEVHADAVLNSNEMAEYINKLSPGRFR